MRHFAAVLWLVSVLSCGACGSDGASRTQTVIIVDADPELTRLAARLYVRMSSDGDEILAREIEKNLWPQRFAVEPPKGDASRSVELLAEVFDRDEELLASHTFTTGFAAGKTRYARILLTKCQTPTEGALTPTMLVDRESLVSAATAMCQVNAGTGGGGAGGKAGSGGQISRAGTGGRGGTGATGTDAGSADASDHARDVCGDGHLTGDELCDTAIAQGELGACPRGCNNRDACNPGTLVGTACRAVCMYTRIREPHRDDGCCPDVPNANQNTDNDCAPRCGNEVIEGDETCDPPSSCTTELLCGTPSACTEVSLQGDPSECSTRCVRKPLEACKTGDGCCPTICNHAQDQDCPVACGDGHVDPDAGETCEPNSSTQPCPTSCDDNDACTDDLTTGGPLTCNVSCSHSQVHVSLNNDGCCPREAGANANNDNDCRPVCGNGVLEQGELCDGRCPTGAADCDDADVCTVDSFNGDTGCQRNCSHARRMPSQTPDGCCPSGANRNTDPDCRNLLEGKIFDSSLPPSTSEPGHPINYVTDDNDDTRWISTAASPVTLTVDLGASHVLHRIEIIWAGDTIRRFDLAVSEDRANWTTFLSGTTSNIQVEPQTYTAPFSAAAAGRYFRITGRDRWFASYGNSIFEVRLYGD